MLRETTLGLALIFAVPAAAQSAPAAVPNANAQPAPAPVKEKKICVTDTSTGSIMPKRICHTQAEWNAINGANKGTIGDLRDQQQIGRMVQGARSN